MKFIFTARRSLPCREHQPTAADERCDTTENKSQEGVWEKVHPQTPVKKKKKRASQPEELI